MTEAFRIEDRGDRRVLWVGERPSMPTHYSERVIRMLIERKGRRPGAALLPVQGRARAALSGAAVPLPARARRRRPPRPRGRLLVRPHDRVPRRAARDRRALDVRHRRGIRRDRAHQGQGARAARSCARSCMLDQAATCHLPWADGAFDLVLAVGVVEHLPERHRRAQVDEYWRVLAPGGHIAILDTPNRSFPSRRTRCVCPSSSVCRPGSPIATRELFADAIDRELRSTSWPTAPAGATPHSPSACRRAGWNGVVDVTEEAGYGSSLLPRHGALANAARAAPAVRRGGARCSPPPACRRRWRCRT